jgi:hypothetical protein
VAEKEPEKVHFNPSNAKLYFMISAYLSPSDRHGLITLLVEFQHIFTWSIYEAPGVSPGLACYSLSVSSNFKLVTKKCRKLALQRLEIIMEEVRRLLAAGAIREVQHRTWLSNTMVVKKKSEKWKVYVDFTDLNKACPRDSFPLPRID